MGVTVTGLDPVVASLEQVEVRLIANLRKAVQVTCGKVKESARSRITGYKHLPAYPYSITYDTKYLGLSVEGEIGPDKSRKQGPLGNIVEFGTSNNAPIPHLGPALDENVDDFLRGVEIAVEQATQ